MFITVSEEGSIERIFYQLLVYFRAILSSDASNKLTLLVKKSIDIGSSHNDFVGDGQDNTLVTALFKTGYLPRCTTSLETS